MTDPMNTGTQPTPVQCCEAIVREIWNIHKTEDHTLPMNEVKDALQMALLVAGDENELSLDRHKALARLSWRAMLAMDRLQEALERVNALARAGLPHAAPAYVDEAGRIIRGEDKPKAA